MYTPKPKHTLRFVTDMELLKMICHTEERLPEQPIEARGNVLESILHAYVTKPETRPIVMRVGVAMPKLELRPFTLDRIILTRNGLPSYESTSNLIE